MPTIASVTDGASYTANVAEGAFFTVWGTNLAPATSGVYPPFPCPTVLGGIKVTFTPVAGGAGTDAYLNYIGAGQINAVLPSTVPVGNYNVTVTNGTVSAPVLTQVVASKPALFTQDQSGTGLAVVQNYISQSESDVNRLTTGNYNGSLSSPAKPGQTLIAWGTGIGPYAAGDNAAGIFHDFSTSEPIAAIVGGVSIPVAFAGRAGYAGEDQINFTLPNNVPTGCAVTLQISVNGVLSAPVSISIAPSTSATACVQPGYTTQQLQTLDQGGTITTGGFSLEHSVTTAPSSGTIKSDSHRRSFQPDHWLPTVLVRHAIRHPGHFRKLRGDSCHEHQQHGHSRPFDELRRRHGHPHWTLRFEPEQSEAHGNQQHLPATRSARQASASRASQRLDPSGNVHLDWRRRQRRGTV